MNDKLFTQELIELVNNNSCSLIGDRERGCAYNPAALFKDLAEDKMSYGNALPEKLSISFKVVDEFIKVTSVSLRTIGCGSLKFNTREYSGFRSSCKSVIERCYLTDRERYGSLKRVVVRFGDGEPEYLVSNGVLTVINIPVDTSKTKFNLSSSSGMLSYCNAIVKKAQYRLKELGNNAIPLHTGYGASRLVREDFAECIRLYGNCKNAENPARKATIMFKLPNCETNVTFYLSQSGVPIGFEEGVIVDKVVSLYNSYN